MAGCNTRLMYDQLAFKEKVEQSKKPGNYHLYENQNKSDGTCFATNGPRSTRFHNSNEIPQFKRADRVEIESLLTGRSFKNAKYLEGRTINDRKKNLNKFKGVINKNCSKLRDYSSTRLDNPAIDIRSLDVTQYHMDYPIINPKEWTFYGFNQNEKDTLRFGRNTQLDARDNYKQKKVVPKEQTNTVLKK